MAISGTGLLSITMSESYNFGGLTIGGVTGKSVVNHIAEFSETLPAGLTDEPVSFGADVLNSIAQGIEAKQNMTVKTYLASVLKDTLVLKANVPLFWNSLKPASLMVFTSDFDEIKVTTGGAPTILNIGVAANVPD